MRFGRSRTVLAVALALATVSAAGAASVERPGDGKKRERRRRVHEAAVQVPMKGTLRDFYKLSNAEMHPDFDKNEPRMGRGLYIGLMAIFLDFEGKPIPNDFAQVAEFLWQNEQDQNIIWERPFIQTLPGDHARQLHRRVRPKDIEQPVDVLYGEQVGDWWRDVDGVNETFEADINFTKQEDGETFVFKAVVPKGKDRGRGKRGKDDVFDMIAKGKAKKKRYTWEGEVTFTFERGSGEYFYVESADDVWVFINGFQVIDLGGCYRFREKRAAEGQRIELDRLNMLTDGRQYTIKVFMADRDKGSEKSHLTMKTNIATLAYPAPPSGP